MSQKERTKLYALSIDAHETAKAKGFWSPGVSANATATKVALIHTEICEVQAALEQFQRHVKGDPILRDEARDHLAEELADVIIRCADLARALGCNLGSYASPRTSPREEEAYLFDAYGLLLTMHKSAAAVTQNDRKDDERETFAALGDVVHLSFVMAHLSSLDLWPAIDAKCEENRHRPERHGRRY